MPLFKKKEIIIESVLGGLNKLYRDKLLPYENQVEFHQLHSPILEESAFVAKPMVLLVGQYSTGKTSFINYLLGEEFPGMRIGPEPTTECFNVVMHGKSERIIPGNALVSDMTKQFRALQSFGNSFLNRFSCSEMANPVLESMTLVDTPGILSGQKQSVSRGYDFAGVLEWFAERVDRIILMFDAHKLDISDEFECSITALHGYDDKIRIILNKSDMVTSQQLMRVYGALMWALGKVIKTPEVARVYIGSFWDQPLFINDNRKLFEAEEHDLLRDLESLPKSLAVRKLNDFVKRARFVKVCCIFISLGVTPQPPSQSFSYCNFYLNPELFSFHDFS